MHGTLAFMFQNVVVMDMLDCSADPAGDGPDPTSPNACYRPAFDR